MTEPETGAHHHVERLRVRFSDTDSMGMAHHSNYFRWLEEARMGFLRDGGTAYSDIERDGVHMPVIECSCRYLAPVFSEDRIEVHLRVSKSSRARIEFEYEVKTTDSGGTVATATAIHAYTDDDGHPIRLPSDSKLWLRLASRSVESGGSDGESDLGS